MFCNCETKIKALETKVDDSQYFDINGSSYNISFVLYMLLKYLNLELETSALINPTSRLIKKKKRDGK